MRSRKLRVAVPIAIGVLTAVGFAFGLGTGTLSGFGWQDIAILCPLGALSTMISSGTVVPRAVVSLVLVVIAIVLFGRAFCGWICPVPVTRKLRGIFRKRTASGKEPVETFCSCDCRGKFDSRHVVLAGALVSAAVFGFPVFCLICPIGLSFATIFLVVLLFGGGDVTWSVIVVPALLLVEVVFFRKWCGRICPLAAFQSLVAKLNRTFVPRVDEGTCVRSHGGTCNACADACAAGIDLKDPTGSAPLNECLKCRSCVESCPVKAITMPLRPKDRRG